MLKLKKISPKNLTNEEVRAYDAKGKPGNGKLGTIADCSISGVICIDEDGSYISNCQYYIKLSDIDREARKQIKEMRK